MRLRLLAILLTMCATASVYGAPPSRSAACTPAPLLNNWRTLDFDTIVLRPNYLFVPLIFEHHQSLTDTISVPSLGVERDAETIETGVAWLDAASAQRARTRATRYRLMVSQPQLVPYNEAQLPEPPKEYVVTADPSKNQLTVVTDVPIETPQVTVDERREIKPRNWLHTFKGSLHFTQAYISDNWYQGGENNLNVLGDFVWEFNLNQILHPNLLFDNVLQYKIGFITAHNDTLRNYSLNEDNFQFTSKFGYKAIKNWYYSANLLFKTQLFNNYKSNTNDMKAAFLSPGELNVGLGMTYNYKDKTGDRTFSLSLSPVSYNLKICRDIDRLDPTTFGIDAGHHTKHNVGSNMEAKFVWKFNPNISWASRLYVFTNYEYVQGDFENTFDFSVTRHLNTKLFIHLRYDKSRPRDVDWNYWQLKEILSFGLTYRFSTN